MRPFRRRLLLAALLLILTACGGGGGDAPAEGSNWDEMVWDQDNWS